MNKIILEQKYLLNKYDIQNRQIDFSNFISVKTMSEKLSESILSVNKSEWVDLESMYKKQLLMKEIDLESAEKKKLIDFAQLKYNGPHSDALQERISVGLGFQLSTSGNTKLKMQELTIELDELNRKSERNIQDKHEKFKMIENKLQSDIQAFNYFQKIMEDERQQLQKLSSKVSQKEGISPFVLLDIEERHLFMKIKSLNKIEDLLRDYLKYLQESKILCQYDTVNYLSQRK